MGSIRMLDIASTPVITHTRRSYNRLVLVFVLCPCGLVSKFWPRTRWFCLLQTRHSAVVYHFYQRENLNYKQLKPESQSSYNILCNSCNTLIGVHQIQDPEPSAPVIRSCSYFVGPWPTFHLQLTPGSPTPIL